MRATLPEPVIQTGHTEGVSFAELNPDQKYLVTASSAGKTIRIWDTATGRLLRKITNAHSGNIASIAISPDGKFILSGGQDARMILWDVKTGNRVWVVRVDFYQTNMFFVP
jgi:WD40 repeat protein